jgi:adenosine deaminase
VLKDHLTGSIQAGAKRVGHGVSFSYLNDDDKSEVAALMRRNNTAVEINFTTNTQIFGVAGDEHPFPHYFRKYGIQAVLGSM